MIKKTAAAAIAMLVLSLSPSGLLRSGSRPRLIRCALVMIRLSAAWRKISVSRTTGTAPEPMMSARTCPVRRAIFVGTWTR